MTQEKPSVVGFSHSTELLSLFKQEQLVLFVSSHQAQRVLVISASSHKLQALMRVFPRPTGLALNDSRLALCTRGQIWFFERVRDIQGVKGEVLQHDLCFTPRRCHVTGDIDAHELVWSNNRIIVVNTRFSCLATLSDDFSFVPMWRPPFVSALTAEDRCHLNGVALERSEPRYVTAMGESDTHEGWREKKLTGGILMEVPSGRMIAENLAMPHSPRLHQDKLYLLESAKGELINIDRSNGTKNVVAQVPGYARGLAFHKNLAFVGLSGSRVSSGIKERMPVEDRVQNLQCGIEVIDLSSGKKLGSITFSKGIEEIFDVQVLSGYLTPQLVGFEEELVQGLFVLP